MGRFTGLLPKGHEYEMLRRLVSGQANLLDITTPATAGEELAIPHSLGRVPRGWWVVKGDAGANGGFSSGAVEWEVDVEVPIEVPTNSRSNIGPYQGWSPINPALSDADLSLGSSINYVWIAPRAGSITAVSGYVDVANTVSETVTFEVKKNGLVVYALSPVDISAGPDIYPLYSTQAVGTDTFVAGDELGIHVNFSGAAAEWTFGIAFLEVTYVETATGTATATGTVTGDVDTGGMGHVDLGATTAWDDRFLYLKFVNESEPLTIAVF
jgi:hypothetical protein